MPIAFESTYARDLDGFSVPWRPQAASAPKSLFFNAPLAAELGLDVDALAGDAGTALFAGNALPDGAQPIAQAYAGHQFGGFSPQLGDGRAVLLGEVVDRHRQRRDIALKGSGRTPFSRGGDGKAAVGPMLREVLIGEAMHALGIPTTRALAVVATGEQVVRESVLPGAVLTRVAASHIRVGTFQFFAARGDALRVQRLADYTIARHDADLVDAPGRYLALLERAIERQARLVAQWLNVGFIHGVMNTDNMTLSGETIDYGPCAFLEAYDPAAVFSSIDSGGRYAYGNQPQVALWNLARLAETLLPLIAEEPEAAAAAAVAALQSFTPRHAAHLLAGRRAKLGLADPAPALGDDGAARASGAGAATAPGERTATDEEDGALADDWLALLAEQRVDFTLAWRRLADAAAGDEAPLRALRVAETALDPWLARWRDRCARDDAAAASAVAGTPAAGSDITIARRPARAPISAGAPAAAPASTGAAAAAAASGGARAAAPASTRASGPAGWARAERMRRVNPFVIPRNHRVEEALAAASDDGDLAPFDRLLAALRRPYEESAANAAFGEPAPAEVTAGYRTFCGT